MASGFTDRGKELMMNELHNVFGGKSQLYRIMNVESPWVAILPSSTGYGKQMRFWYIFGLDAKHTLHANDTSGQLCYALNVVWEYPNLYQFQDVQIGSGTMGNFLTAVGSAQAQGYKSITEVQPNSGMAADTFGLFMTARCAGAMELLQKYEEEHPHILVSGTGMNPVVEEISETPDYTDPYVNLKTRVELTLRNVRNAKSTEQTLQKSAGLNSKKYDELGRVIWAITEEYKALKRDVEAAELTQEQRKPLEGMLKQTRAILKELLSVPSD